MWSPAILLLLIGATFANQQNGWTNGKQYTYAINSRTIATFNQQSKYLSGIVIEAYLTVQPNGEDTLRAKIWQPRYSPIHTQLENGWDSEIPQNLINLQTFPLSGKPFEIKTKNGVVRDLIVDKDVPTWEVNVLKGIVSQLQIDTSGENVKKSKRNQLPEENQPFAFFKAMEDSVGGKCEVLYDISPLPEQVLQNKPELAPMPELREDGDMISLVKTKNYSNCEQRAGYHFNINGRNAWEPGSNENRKYLSRSSVSRVIISGNLRKYTIQSSVTTNKVVHHADNQEENQQGMVASRMNLTLHKVEDMSEPMESPVNPQSTGNLVYNYNSPIDSISARRPNKYNQKGRSDEKNKNSDESDSESDSDGSVFDNNDDSYLQPKPKLTDAPLSPLLPFFIGNNGNSILKNKKVDAVKSATSIAQEIGNEMQNPDIMFAEQTLEKFTILSKLIRTMNSEQIASVQRSLYERAQSLNQLKQNNPEQLSRRNAWVAFRDAVAQAGTGPALVNIKQWVQNKQIEGTEATHVIDTLAKSVRIPTPEYMDTYFELIKMEEVKRELIVRDAAVLSFADLIRHAVVNKKSAHNHYPVHAFGRLLPKNFRQLHEKYIPYLEEELLKAVDAGDSRRIHTYTIALGKTAHPRVLAVFEPYLEGKKPISPYQRLVMVLSLNKLASIFPKVGRSVLYKIYSNTADYHEIRTAAVYLLMQSNPSASMLQRMAEFTNYDTSKYVNSAVKSTIESLAQLHDNHEYQGLLDSARAAQPLLTSESYGPQYSKQMFFNLRNPLTQSDYFIQASTIGSEDSIIPKGVYVITIPTYNGMKMPKIEIGGEVSSLKNLWNFVQQRISNSQRSDSNEKPENQKYSPENLAKLLGIYGEETEQIEGFAFINDKFANHFLTFDNHTLEKIPGMLRQLAEDMKQGRSFDATKLKNFEVTISFPTETGFPFRFTVKNPTITSVSGVSHLKTTSGSGSRSEWPKASLSGNVRIVYGLQTQKRLGFVTPFEHQEYMVGIDKDMQVYLPVRSEIEYDVNKGETRLRIQPNENLDEFKIIQYRTQPFTSKHDILNLEPITKDSNTATVHKNRATSSQIELNDNNNKQRLQFNWERQMRHLEEEIGNSYNKRQNAMEAMCKLTQSISSMFYLNSVDSEYQKYSVKVSPGSDMSAEMRISHDSMITENSENTDNSESWSPNAKTVHLERSLSEQERKQTLLKEASKNINSAEANVVDISLQLNGDMQSSVALTAAFADSNVDRKSRALLYASVETKGGQDYHVSAGFEGKNPNIESLDFEEILKANDRREYDLNVHYGIGTNENDENKQNRIKVRGEIKQTEERKKQIRQSHDARVCMKQQSLHGDKMTSACKRINKRASLADAGDFTVTFPNKSPMREIVMSAWDAAERMTQSVSHSWKNRMIKEEDNKVKVTFEMSPNDEKVDVTVKTPEGQIQLNNIKVALISNKNNGNVKDNRNEDDEELNKLNDNVCQLDKTQARTFDNHRYPLQLGSCWHIAMTPYPKHDPDTPSKKLEIPENMQVSILTRENENGQKELKITLGESLIELSASGPRQTHAKVNGNKVHYSKHKSYKEKKHGKVLFELFELSDESLKLVSKKYDIEIVYDGYRAQIETGERYRDSVRGLCGNNDGESMNDQQTPKGCLLQKPEEFSATYALTNDDQCQGPAIRNADEAKKSQCSYQTIRPGNVISEKEAGRETELSQDSDGAKHCMTHRTKIIRSKNEICFSLRPIPTCLSKCSPSSIKSKAIPFHCVAKNSASQKVAERVEKGANPDLTQKSVSKTLTEQLPINCKA
ncbi:vitellogenin [Nasonia vitripennis]|uniref:Vitellogenin n=1 Tax=Nasonia vitripennis TaxID=7425 RepID=A0A7M7G8Q5_NASVI|nr:vitellogenin [Nasonia vitripennis]